MPSNSKSGKKKKKGGGGGGGGGGGSGGGGGGGGGGGSGGGGGGGSGGGGGGGGSGSGSAREAEGHTSPGGRFWPAPQWDAGELPTPKPTDRHDNLRPTSGLEIELAKVCHRSGFGLGLGRGSWGGDDALREVDLPTRVRTQGEQSGSQAGLVLPPTSVACA